MGRERAHFSYKSISTRRIWKGEVHGIYLESYGFSSLNVRLLQATRLAHYSVIAGWCRVVPCGVVWCGVVVCCVWYALVLCGFWCGIVRCGTVLSPLCVWRQVNTLTYFVPAGSIIVTAFFLSLVSSISFYPLSLSLFFSTPFSIFSYLSDWRGW